MTASDIAALPDWNDPSLEGKLAFAFEVVFLPAPLQNIAKELLTPLRKTDPITQYHYQHSIRVGLYAQKIAAYLHLNQRELLLGGLLHDVGKSCIPLELLAKADLRLGENCQWTDNDAEKIQRHVLEGYHRIKEKALQHHTLEILEIIADIVVRHHCYQQHPYPEKLPSFPRWYDKKTKERIGLYAQLVALADKYDAFHRVIKMPPPTSEEIKEKMQHLAPETKPLVDILYQEGIFTS